MKRPVEIFRFLCGLDDRELAEGSRARIRIRVGSGAAITAALLVLSVSVGIAFVTNAQSTNDLPTELLTTATPQDVEHITVETSLLTVHLSGGVTAPGIYSLSSGSRVIDAIMAAGGLQSGVDDCGVNLAREIRDGEQITLGGECAENTQSSSDVVSLNDASGEELDSLPGIGPTLAQRIISWRDSNGGFASIEQLNEVPGIGDKLYAGVAELVTL
ncbi:competence protein ComEA [Aurantimicrobium minutum]|uniref:ComEA family DNA-binding protein n=1 Tax=Aurantimicrobium minutum TaxID=708131 RepID=UPI002474F84C|nr:ComEA family DNA-binding protein [Aurantimicrobium minutum]MDH6532882.1 competence protein ComEA [Aurantimicrobium minutum]